MEKEDGLVRRAREGDRAAFEELVRRTTRSVYAHIYLQTGDPQEAEDLVQETFMRAFRSIGKLAEPKGFRSWLMAVAHSATIDAHRRNNAKRRAAPKRAGQEVLDRTPAPETFDRIEEREKVRAILQSLPEEYRLPLTLRYIQGADYETIQMQLGMSNGSLRGVLHRGLGLLRKAWKLEVKDESQ